MTIPGTLDEGSTKIERRVGRSMSLSEPSCEKLDHC